MKTPLLSICGFLTASLHLAAAVSFNNFDTNWFNTANSRINFRTNSTQKFWFVTNAFGLTGSTATFIRSDGTQATPGGGGGFAGAVSNNVASAGLLAVDSTKTNGVAATLAMVTNVLGLTGATSTFLRSDGTQAAPPGTASNWTASGTTNSSLDGGAFLNFLRATNHVSFLASTVPGTPTSGIRLYSDTTNHFGWIGTNGFTRIFDGTGNTANRTYTLPDKDGTVAEVSDINYANVTNALALTGSTATFLRSDGIQAAPAGSGGGTVGTMINTTTPVQYDLVRFKSTDPTNAEPSTIVANGSSLKLGHDAASPVAQTIIASGPRGGTDSNVAGASMNINGSPGTGTGTGGAINIGTSPAGSTGSTTNASVTALSIASTGVATFSFQLVDSYTSVASTPAETLTGTWFAGGSATTTKPHFLIEPTGTTSTGWVTTGTGLGINAASGFAGNLMDLQLNGATKLSVASGGTLTSVGDIIAGNQGFTTTASTGWYKFTSRGNITAPADGQILFRNNGNAGFTTLQLGPDDSSPDSIVNVRGANGVGTDIAGGSVGYDGGGGTGTGAGGDSTLRTTFSSKSTGSAANTKVDRFRVVAKGKVLTSTSASSLFEVALPTLTMCGGKIEATIVCTDGTDMQSFSQTIVFSAVNKGGTYTTQIVVDPTDLISAVGAKSVSAGTLTTVWSVLNGTNKITVQLTPTTSLTPSTNAFIVYYTVTNNSEQAITIL